MLNLILMYVKEYMVYYEAKKKHYKVRISEEYGKNRHETAVSLSSAITEQQASISLLNHLHFKTYIIAYVLKQ